MTTNISRVPHLQYNFILPFQSGLFLEPVLYDDYHFWRHSIHLAVAWLDGIVICSGNENNWVLRTSHWEKAMKLKKIHQVEEYLFFWVPVEYFMKINIRVSIARVSKSRGLFSGYPCMHTLRKRTSFVLNHDSYHVYYFDTEIWYIFICLYSMVSYYLTFHLLSQIFVELIFWIKNHKILHFIKVIIF